MLSAQRSRGIHVRSSLGGELAVEYDDPPSGAGCVLGAGEELLLEGVFVPDVLCPWDVSPLILIRVAAVQDEVLVHQTSTPLVSPQQL